MLAAIDTSLQPRGPDLLYAKLTDLRYVGRGVGQHASSWCVALGSAPVPMRRRRFLHASPGTAGLMALGAHLGRMLMRGLLAGALKG